ncbi:MAG: hypothetical protein LBI18_08880, partial [Planctomycetaceae bacterium]|nr:hypothetical protein [Planctomycetaceae bacterium]
MPKTNGGLGKLFVKFWGNLIFFVALMIFCCYSAKNLNAEVYEVGSGKDYANLKELQESVNTWTSGDKIVLFGDDDSLEAAFDFGGANITMSGYGKI